MVSRFLWDAGNPWGIWGPTAHTCPRGTRSIEAKALVVEATGDPMSGLLASVVTWTLSEYYER